MINSPLYTALIKHKRKRLSSFHTPGHKCSRKFLKKNLLSLDFTELSDTDSLFEASGAIRDTEKQAEKLFSTKRTLVSAGGCTLCIQTMLKLCSKGKKKIVISRLIHKSAINTLALLNLEPIWVYPRKDAGESYPGRIYAEDVENALSLNKDVCAVYITSPDYYGVISNIKEISLKCKKYGVPLLVDGAHGSHLPFLNENLDPIKQGASMVASSMHKTMPVLTGGAYLHICNEKYAYEAKSAMSLFGSTSPSYPIMASLDLANMWCDKYGRKSFLKLQQEIEKIKIIAKSKGIGFPLGETDPIRLCLDVSKIGLIGTEVGEFFRHHHIEPEYCDQNSVVLIATPFNNKKDFRRLKKAILLLNAKPASKNMCNKPYDFPKPVAKIPPRDAVFSTSKLINVKNAAGRIAAESVCPCPPGVPIVMPGEEITNRIISDLTSYGIFVIYVVE